MARSRRPNRTGRTAVTTSVTAPGCSAGTLARSKRRDTSDPLGRLLAHDGVHGAVEREERQHRAVLLDRGIDTGDVSTRCFDRNVELGRLPYQARRLMDLDRRSWRAPGEHQRATKCQDNPDNPDDQTASHGYMIAVEGRRSTIEAGRSNASRSRSASSFGRVTTAQKQGTIVVSVSGRQVSGGRETFSLPF